MNASRWWRGMDALVMDRDRLGGWNGVAVLFSAVVAPRSVFTERAVGVVSRDPI